MSKPSFKGARLKLERAKQHIKDFHSRAETFCESTSAHLFVENDAHTRERTLTVEVDTTVPDEFSLITGDAVHNLRSSLDHLTWDIIRPFSPERPHDVQFPFVRKAEGFESAIPHRQIQLAGEEVVQRFRELKPYPGGDDLLYGLHQLDIADKHQLILTVQSLVGFERLDIRDIDPTAPEIIIEKTAFSRVGKDNRIAVWNYDPTSSVPVPDQTKEVRMAMQIMFREGQPLAQKGVFQSLRAMAMAIESIIDSFES